MQRAADEVLGEGAKDDDRQNRDENAKAGDCLRDRLKAVVARRQHVAHEEV